MVDTVAIGGTSACTPLVVEHLAAEYDKRQVLGDISFTVAPKEIRVILGGSGCGKTTLLRHAVGLIRPTNGQVRLLDVDLASADDAARDEVLGRIGMLFQGGALLNSFSLLENVALPLRERCVLDDATIMDIAWMKLNQVGLAHATQLYPPQLSGGMRKRAALARAMALDPEVLFCDEPSAGLDPVTAAELDQLLLGLREQFGMAIVVVTHELASLRAIADKVVMLEAGHVVADGPLDVVERMEHPSVRAFFDRTAKPMTSHGPSVWDALGA